MPPENNRRWHDGRKVICYHNFGEMATPFFVEGEAPCSGVFAHPNIGESRFFSGYRRAHVLHTQVLKEGVHAGSAAARRSIHEGRGAA